MPSTPASPGEFRRLTELSMILIRYGLGDFLRYAGVDQIVEKAGELLHRSDAERIADRPAPERLRCALEEMGPTFIKLGQILSTRVDLLPPDYIHELEKLRDHVPTLPFENLVTEIEAELGRPLSEVFARIDTVPLAAGSIAQTHRAQLPTGEEVVVKIRRPGIRGVIEADLRLLRRLARFAARRFDDVARLHPEAILREFANSIHVELDFAIEGRNAETIAKNFEGDPAISTPKVFWDWTSELMNVQAFIDGVRGSDPAAVDAGGFDKREIARRGANAVLKMMFEDRFFHADPHPGNVFYLSGNRLVFIDFGMVGQLSRQRRDEMVDLLYGMVERRPDKVTEILLTWADADERQNLALEGRIDAFIDRIHGVALDRLDIASLTRDLFSAMRDHNLALPSDLTLMAKAFASLDGMGRQLDPGFDMVAEAQPFLRRQMMRRYAPDRVLRKAKDGAAEGVDLVTGLPRDLKKLLQMAQRGQLNLGIDVVRMERYLDRFDRSVTRVSMAIVTAALIVGSSMVMSFSGAKLPVGLSVFAMLGFAGSVIGGFWLIYTTWRGNGRR
ncbi:ABC1 kinase family protein [Tropicimonas isoalkanivorans]|uniref:2-octaprenylphenol hydroxylase n=1 Tax=Tropicimonas isoalkanivorans TaxID=441112 RepID=A0A1I1KVI1_9RHOB|nr:AarF/UbiB family protein [Tropicimonas isoalkanivorans]SFC64837.1 2-octaprenylphenol hydroxylase [Tropicimonas isoalkanivorans]